MLHTTPGGLSYVFMSQNPNPSPIDITHMVVTYADIGERAMLIPGDGRVPAVLILPIDRQPRAKDRVEVA